MIPDNDAELIADFRAWLATKDPAGTFRFISNNDCCFAQYLVARGYDPLQIEVLPDEWNDLRGVENRRQGIRHRIPELIAASLLNSYKAPGDVIREFDNDTFGHVALWMDYFTVNGISALTRSH
jgi:hypothetical protein